MPEGFCFLFVFDYRSVFRRKNPLGLVEAFCRAFEPGRALAGDQVDLRRRIPGRAQALTEAIADRPEIQLVEDTVTTGEKNAMIANCDCYVSLHRSEGLGLTMAEAMYFGKPVIATAYSGNLDFMTEGNSYLVPFKMTEIGPDAEPYPADKQWAEPDLDAAAAVMREVYERPEGATDGAGARPRTSGATTRPRRPVSAQGTDRRGQTPGLLSRVDTPIRCRSHAGRQAGATTSSIC